MEPEYDIENPRERRRSRARSARKRRREHDLRNREDAAIAAAAAGQALAAKKGETDIPMLIVYIIGGLIVILAIVLLVGVMTKKDPPKRKNSSGRYTNIQNRGPGDTVVEVPQPKKGLDLSGPAWAIGGAVTALGTIAVSGKKTGAGSLAGNGTCSNGDPTMADKLEGMFSDETKPASQGVGVLDWFTWIFWLIGLFGLYKIGDACIDGKKPCGDDNDKAEGCTKWVGKVLGCFLLLTIGGIAAGGFLYIMMELFNPGGFQWDKVRPEYCTYDKIMNGDGIESDNSQLNAMGRGVACAAITRSRGVMAWSSTMNEMYKDGQDLSFEHGGGYVGSGLFSALVSPEWLVKKLISLPMLIFWYPLTKANESNGTDRITSLGVRLGLFEEDDETIKNLQEDSKKWFYWVPGLSLVFGREYKEPWYKRIGYSMMGSLCTWGASFLFAGILYCLLPFFWKGLASYIPDSSGLKHVKALLVAE